MDKERKKAFRRRLGWFALRAFTFFHGIFPLGWSYFLGKVLGSIVYFVLPRHRKVALDSLSVAFSQIPLKEKKRMTRDFFVFMAQSGLEMFFFLKSPQALDGVRIEGKEYLQQAFKKGKGIIILTAHLGNFPLMSLKLAKEGFPVHFVTRPMRDAKAGEYLHELRSNAGVKTIYSYPRKACVSGIVNALRNKEMVIIQMDQNFGTGGVWVKFFNKLAATPVGPVVFALRTGASVVPAYIYREAKGKHCIKVLPEEELVLTEHKDKSILVNAIKFTRIIENWVKHVPSQWGWIHRRWKSRPSQETKNMKFKVEGADTV